MTGHTYFMQLLPYIEQSELWDKYRHLMNIPSAPILNYGGMRDWRKHVEAELKTAVPIFVCPTDIRSPRVELGHPDLIGFTGNYIMCAGSTTFGARGWSSQIFYRMNGIFYNFSSTRMRDILDGSSNPLLSGETIVHKTTPRYQFDCRGSYYWGVWGGALYSSFWPPNTNTPDRLDEPRLCYDTPETPGINSGDMANYTRSRHNGGVFVGMADGSVRFVSNNIDRFVFQTLGSRGGEEVVAGF